MSENPPLLAPEGFFDEDELQLYPGKIIEYGDNLTPAAAFQQMQFNPQIFMQDITFLNDLMAEVSGIFPNMVGAIEEGGTKTATEINVKTQGQMTRLAMIVDTINQDLIIPNVEKVAKLCADFKSGVETIFVSKDNKQEYIEIDDSVRQGDYKYTYSDNSATAVKSEQADLVVSAVERFAQVIPLNIEEIFLWYFEQKGVDNPERFLAQGINGEQIENGKLKMKNLAVGQVPPDNNLNPENQLSNNLPRQNSLLDFNTLTLLLGLLQQVNKEKGDKAKPEDFIKVLENILAQENNNEVQELQK